MKIGTDIVVIERIKKALDKFGDKYKKRFLSDEEIESLSQKPDSIAGYWAAKEAISKALGCGIGQALEFHDIILYKDSLNAPHFRLNAKAQKLHKVIDSSLSISHDGGFAIAVVAITQQKDI